MKQMNIKLIQKRFFQVLMFCTGLFVASVSHAHLMKPEHGTLNFKDDGVYMVLSLPASLFDAADENNDNLLSSSEFSKHQFSLTNRVQNAITLDTKTTSMVLQGIMLKADTPHDSPNSPAPNIVVLGKFLLPNTNDSLHFSVDFFESKAMQESIEF